MTPDYELIFRIVKGLIPPLATLLAAFSGAWFAYRLQIEQKSKDVRAVNIAAANYALFNLFQKLNTIKLIQKNLLDPMRGRPEAFIKMQPTLPDDHSEMRFDFSSLDFLLSTKHKQLLIDLWLEEQRFREAIKVLNYRSNLYSSEVQPKLIAYGIQEGTTYSNTEFEKALGNPLYKTLQRSTEHVFDNIDRTVSSLDDLRAKLGNGLKDLFPEGNFLKFEIIPDDSKGQ